jgi:hypothetical protein
MGHQFRGKFKPAWGARRQKHEAGRMNKTEAEYAGRLEIKKRAGEILDYRFEHLKIRLADKTFYTPDFVVYAPDGMEFHEVKGHWEDDARVKIKVAAEQNQMHRFVAICKIKGQWHEEDF